MKRNLAVLIMSGTCLLFPGPTYAENNCARNGWQAQTTCVLNGNNSGAERSYLKDASINSTENVIRAPERGSLSGEIISSVKPGMTPDTEPEIAPNVVAAKIPDSSKKAEPVIVVPSSAANDNKPVTPLDKITVTATRSKKSAFEVPGMATIVTRDDPKVAGASDYKSLLADVPGLEFQGSARRNGQVPVIRGFDADSILILKDGVRQNFQSQHDGQFFLDPELLKQVEVVRGPGSTLYGSGGLGGIISFTTVDAADLLEPGQNLGAKVSLGGQTVNKEFLTSAAAYGRSGKFDVLSNVVYRQSGDIKLGDGSTLQSDDSVKSGLGKLAWNVAEDQKLRLSYEGYQNDAEEPNNPQTPRAEGTNGLAAKSSFTQTGRLAYEYQDARAQVYHTVTDVEEEQLERSEASRAGDVLVRKLKTTGMNLDNQNKFLIADNIPNKLSYGIEYYTNSQDGEDSGSASGNRGGVPDAESNFYGSYLQDEILFDDGRITLTPGARFDKYSSENSSGSSQDENAISPKVSLGYKPEPWLLLFGNYAEAFRAPNLTELYASGTHFNVGPFQNNFIPNPDLKPEKSGNVEIGFGFTFNDVLKRSDSWRLKLSGYHINAEDYIDARINSPQLSTACFLPNPPPGTVCNGGSTQYVNIPTASIDGFDLEGGYDDNLLAITLGYTRMNGRNDDTGDYITNLAPDTLKTSLGFKLPEYQTVVGWRGQLVSKFDKVNNATAIRGGYQVHDLFLEYKPRKNVALNFGIDNIFDEAYERVFAGSFEAGRNYKVKASYKW